MNVVLGYRAAAESQAFMDTLKSLYAANRRMSRDGFEKSEHTAAYWAGRADSIELIIDNCINSTKAKIA